MATNLCVNYLATNLCVNYVAMKYINATLNKGSGTVQNKLLSSWILIFHQPQRVIQVHITYSKFVFSSSKHTFKNHKPNLAHISGHETANSKYNKVNPINNKHIHNLNSDISLKSVGKPFRNHKPDSMLRYTVTHALEPIFTFFRQLTWRPASVAWYRSSCYVSEECKYRLQSIFKSKERSGERKEAEWIRKADHNLDNTVQSSYNKILSDVTDFTLLAIFVHPLRQVE